MLLSSQGAWFGRVAPIKPKSTVGAGDSMVGAMAARLYKEGGQVSGDLLRWGLAAAAATLTTAGTELGSKQAIMDFYGRIEIKSL